MNTRLIGLALLVFGTQCWAGAGGLYNADVIEKTAVSDPAGIVKEVEGQWLAFSIPAIDGTRSPCCWKGKWNGLGESECSLEKGHQSYGTRDDSPPAENVLVYGKVGDGEIRDMRVVGESCPVDAVGATVTWIGDVDEESALDWLESAARSDEGHALHAMAIYRGNAAGQRLYDLAKKNEHEISENAIFWLGNSRGQQGFKLLKKLLDDLPVGDNRRQINFALAQNNSEKAAELLLAISQSDADPEQRGEAMFWLSQEYPVKARDWLVKLIDSEQNADVLEQAVFAISQLPDSEGDVLLLDLAKNPAKPRFVRQQAIFWLAQSDSDDSIVALTELLTR